MKLVNRILGSTMLAAVIGVSTAQASVQATFHLPVVTHWGRAVLAPGDYRVVVQDSQSNTRNVMIQGQGQTVYAMPLVAEGNNSLAHSHLQLVQQGGSYFIKEYCSQLEGKTYSFGVPKKQHSEKEITVEFKK